MLTIEFQFLSSRYHATPWGHNVNEGIVEWPPSPYRLVRALVDVWKRRKPKWPAERVEPILQALCEPPKFLLPPATASHTRSYLNSNQKDPFAQQLIFDAFVVTDRNSKLLLGVETDLPQEKVGDLNELLEELNYLGRSESWVKAQVVVREPDVEWNCFPVSENAMMENTETVQLSCLLSPEEHDQLPYKPESATWLNALCMTTKEILMEGWSSPPAMRMLDYQRSVNALKPTLRKMSQPSKTKFHCAKYQLQSSVLPRVQETVQFSERIRAYLMGIHKRIQGDDPSKVSMIFSGKNPEGGKLTGHKHAYYLPLDEDGDGRLDHLIVVAKNPFSHSELKALDLLRSVWQSKGRPDVNIILVSLSEDKDEHSSYGWASATPFVTTRHHRKGRGTYEEWLTKEIKKECSFHGIPEPTEIQLIGATLDSHPIRWMEFTRSRKSKTPLRGHGCILSFAEPIKGPFALGALCHFGLGLFIPY